VPSLVLTLSYSGTAATAAHSLADEKLVCPDKVNVCRPGMYSGCGTDNKCICREGTVASPLEGHADAFGNPTCVGESLDVLHRMLRHQ
jgi:hypothetical protein